MIWEFFRGPLDGRIEDVDMEYADYAEGEHIEKVKVTRRGLFHLYVSDQPYFESEFGRMTFSHARALKPFAKKK